MDNFPSAWAVCIQNIELKAAVRQVASKIKKTISLLSLIFQYVLLYSKYIYTSDQHTFKKKTNISKNALKTAINEILFNKKEVKALLALGHDT